MRHWPDSSAVGKFLQLPIGASPPLLEIVGVVTDVKQFSLDRHSAADLYVPLVQMPASQAGQLAARMYWVIRTRDDPNDLQPVIRNAVHSVDPDVATSGTRTLHDILQVSLSPRRLTVRLLEGFAGASMGLSLMGVYAIAWFSAGTRKRELAIRSAFGASRQSLTSLVFVEEARPVLLGLFIGIPAAFILSRLFNGLIFAISPGDPLTYAGVAAVLLAVNAVAVYVPASRAGGVDPVQLLRE